MPQKQLSLEPPKVQFPATTERASEEWINSFSPTVAKPIQKEGPIILYYFKDIPQRIHAKMQN